jgi:cellulose biosynthesis protein BcsQ
MFTKIQMTSSIAEPPYISDFVEFEQHVAKLFSRQGWTVETAEPNQVGYDLVVKKEKYVGAVQVKWLKNNVSAPQLLRLVDFLESPAGKKFNCGFFITTKGFGGPARALIRSWGQEVKIACGIALENQFKWINKEPPTTLELPNRNKIYFGVFTCKGGVGKTTVAAHLAGALALQNFDIALIDLDPEQNLHKLIGDGVYVPNPGGVGNTIEVFNEETWSENAARNCKIVICDCSPALERNPREFIEKLDYCIIPTTLNPLGINKHGKVIQDTVREIREINQKAHLFVLVNHFKDPGIRRFRLLRETFINAYKEINKNDKNFYCIDPEEVCIRASDHLYYWGIHLLEDPKNPRSELAFNLIGGRCYPRDDFIKLADYIEEKAGLGIFRQNS